MADDYRPFFSGKVTVLLFAMGFAALAITIYHIIAICLCANQFRDRNREQTRPDRNLVTGTPQTPNINESNSVADLIPSHKYRKRMDVTDEDGTCAVCLGDFEEGEELKTMPECMHSFHVPCIDMWLYSHSSCPICRTDATPSPVHRILVPVS